MQHLLRGLRRGRRSRDPAVRRAARLPRLLHQGVAEAEGHLSTLQNSNHRRDTIAVARRRQLATAARRPERVNIALFVSII